MKLYCFIWFPWLFIYEILRGTPSRFLSELYILMGVSVHIKKEGSGNPKTIRGGYGIGITAFFKLCTLFYSRGNAGKFVGTRYPRFDCIIHLCLQLINQFFLVGPWKFGVQTVKHFISSFTKNKFLTVSITPKPLHKLVWMFQKSDDP